MNNFKMGLSIRYKLLLVLSCLPIICLSLYLMMATSLFQKDKVAYVFDSSVTISKSIATQSRLQVDAVFSNLKPICESYDYQTNAFTETAKLLFNRQPNLRALVFLQKNPQGTFDILGSLAKDEAKDGPFTRDRRLHENLRGKVAKNVSYIMTLKQYGGSVGAAFRTGDVNEPDLKIILALYDSDDLVANFDGGSSVYQTYLMDSHGNIAMGPDDSMVLMNINEHLGGAGPEGSAEVPGTDGATYLMSYAPAGIGDLTVISYVDKKKALKAVEILVAKSLMFFIALIATTVIISVFASGKLTSTLSELFEATKKIANGDFNVKIESRSRDEVGGLATSFTWMAAEVSRLMSETAQKARMENELATVKTVQETLFPPAAATFGPVQLCGHFEPASECGGDWWSYSKVGDRVFLWMGDATGHGAPAALITSAARSAAAVIETFPDMSPALALKVLNHAIHQTSKGKINMTFFIGALDLNSGLFTYACASHDPPYLMKRRPGEKLKKKDLIPLLDVNGPRLGEKPDTVYPETSVQLQKGDLIFFYTDGIMDIQNPGLEKWGERTFLKTLLDIANGENTTVTEKVSIMIDTIGGYRQGTELIDDVTMMMVEFNQEEQAQAA